MPNILLSIHPKHCQKILAGEKTAEIRKTRPILTGSGPPRIYLYETKEGRGAVVGECVCFRVSCFNSAKYEYIQKASCLTEQEIAAYSKGKKYYAWLLKDVTPYRNPRPIVEFGFSRAPQSWRYLKE